MKLLHTMLIAIFLLTFTACSSNLTKNIQDATDVMTIATMIKTYDHDAVSARKLLNDHYAKWMTAETLKNVTTQLNDVLDVKQLLRNPKSDIIYKLENTESQYLLLKKYVNDNWSKVEPRHKPFMSSFMIKMDTFYKTVNHGKDKGVTTLQYLTLVNSLYQTLTNK